MEESCENCKYCRPATGGGMHCQRRAPVPFNALVFHLGELVRSIAWNAHVKAFDVAPEEDSDVGKEVTEAPMYTVWPDVEINDWCGEWKKK